MKSCHHRDGLFRSFCPFIDLPVFSVQELNNAYISGSMYFQRVHVYVCVGVLYLRWWGVYAHADWGCCPLLTSSCGCVGVITTAWARPVGTRSYSPRVHALVQLSEGSR